MFKNSKYHQLRYPNPVNALICKILRSGVRVSQIFCFTKGAFTRQSKNGTDPTKTGTVPLVFAKKQ